MNCKKCNAELEEGVQICPECGMNQAEAAENAVPAEVKADKREPKMVPLRMVVAVAVVVALIAVFAVVIFGGLIGKQNVDPTEGTVPSQEVNPGATIPGTGLNDVSCKGSYTVSDEEAVAAKDTVIATVGNQKLTVGQLQAYYWLQTRSFLYSNSYYLSMLGLDYTRGLDEQMISAEVMASLGAEAENMTWQQFFLSQALDAWHTYAALLAAAEEEGYVLSEEDQAYLDGLDATLQSDAETNGFATVDEMVAYLMGNGAGAADYKAYESTYFSAYTYYTACVNSKTYTPEELEAYFDAHAAEYEANGLTKDMYTVNVRHILVFPEGATSETIRTETFPQEAWDAGKAKAEALLQQWLDGEATEESFGLLANEHSDDQNGQVTNGGLYEEIAKGQMVANFENWCFDPTREPGHYGIVETEFGYHIMYFVNKNAPLWPEYAENDMRTEAANTLLDDSMTKFPMEVDFKSIVLGLVNLAE